MPPAAGLQELENLFTRIISIFVGLAFVALVIVLVYGGIRFLTSGGDPKALKAGSDTFTWALLGMLFLVIAWLILQLIEAFTGVKVTAFDIKGLCPGAIMPDTKLPIPGCP